MAQYSLAEVTCMCCGTEHTGVIHKFPLAPDLVDAMIQDANFNFKDIAGLGYECNNCGAFICKEMNCWKKIKWNRWSGWNKVLCKECGQAFQLRKKGYPPNRVLLSEEIVIFINRLLAAEKEEPFIGLYVHESKDYSKSDVEKMKRANNVKGLEGVVKSKTTKLMVIYEAMLALIAIEERLKDGEAVTSIIGLLDSSEVSIRSITARELSRIKWDSRVVDALILALEDNEHPVDTGASDIDLLYGRNVKTSPQEHAVDSLAEIGDPKGLEALTPIALHYERMPNSDTNLTFFKGIGEPVVDFLIQGLSMDDWQCRQRAADALRIIGDPKAVVPLITSLNDEEGIVRSKVAQALITLGDDRCIEPLLPVLSDRYILARKNAKDAINNIISTQNDATLLTKMFIQALSAEDHRVRSFAAEVLGRIGDKSAIEPLQLALQDKNRKVQNAARKSIKKL